MKKVIGRSLFVLILLAALSAAYLFLGFSSKDVKVDYAIRIDDPASGRLSVQMVIYPSGNPYLHLFLRDPQSAGMDRVTDLTVSRANRTLPFWQTLPGVPDCRSLWLGFSREPVTITYKLYADCAKGQLKFLSHLNGDFGYLRVMNTFYTPITFKEFASMLQRLEDKDTSSGMASVSFSLPESWALNAPWDPGQPIPITYLRNIYLGLGHLTVLDLGKEVPVSLAVSNLLPEETLKRHMGNIPRIFNAYVEMTKVQPITSLPMWAITILPQKPIYGGASGESSLVTEDDLSVLAHEIFHWWNGVTFVTTKDANWIKEGFSKYYEAKVLFKLGLLTEDDFAEHLSKLHAIARRCHAEGKLDLIAASQRLIIGKGSQKDSDAVYFGGASVAYKLDAELHKQGKTLDDLWSILYDNGKPISSQDFVDALKGYGGDDLAKLCDEMIHGRITVLMD